MRLSPGDVVCSFRTGTSRHWYIVLDMNVGPYNTDYVLLNTGKVINASSLVNILSDWIDKGEAILL